MVDLVFHGSTIPDGVAPVMFGDEFAEGALTRQIRFSGRGRGYGAAPWAGSPCVIHSEFAGAVVNAMRHGNAGVILAVRQPSDGGYSDLGHEFANEDDTTAVSATNVKAQVHFFKRLVKRHGTAEQASLVEFETNEAGVGDAVMSVEFSSCRNERAQQLRLDDVVQHEQVLPFGGEEGALLSQWVHILLIALLVIELRESFAPDQVRTS